MTCASKLRLRRAATAAGLLAAVAWSKALPQAPRDSAGIRVAHYALTAQPAATWHVQGKPIVEFGGANGSGPTEFTRIMGLARLSDGRIVLADGASSEIRFFSESGTYIDKTAGPGSGPGESQDFDRFVVVGDTLYAYDQRNAVHSYTAHGEYLRSVRWSPMIARRGELKGTPMGLLAGGRMVRYRQLRSDGRNIALGVDSVGLSLTDRDGNAAIDMGTHAWGIFAQAAGDRGPRSVGFSPQLVTAVFPDQLCIAWTERYEITCKDTLGVTKRIIRRAVVRRSVTADMRARTAFRLSGRLPGGGSRFEGSLRAHREQVARTIQFRPALPALHRMVVSRTGDLWVSDLWPEDDVSPLSPLSSPEAPTTWSVLAPDGGWIAAVALPAHFHLFDVGHDWVLGVSRDTDELERVTLLRLVR